MKHSCQGILLLSMLLSGFLFAAEIESIDLEQAPGTQESNQEQAPALSAEDTEAEDDFLEQELEGESPDHSGSEEKDPDPWRGLNEKTHAFNEFFDRNLLKPVAKGYKKVTPTPVNKGITNFFNNLKEPFNFVNDLLQAKPGESAVDLGRFTVNSTVGLLGFFDVATRLNWQRNKEDFGQTLGKWGVPSGPYLVIPFLGPSTLRDGTAKIPEFVTNLNPIVYATDDSVVLVSATVISAIDARADLLDAEKILFGDRYTAMRDFYLQTREFDVKDGNIEDDFMSEDDLDW